MSKSDPVFLHYDQAALDREYNNRDKVPDYADHLDRWQALSMQARRELEAQLDLGYGPSAAETLDVFTVAGRNAPVQVFFHGGYWKMLHKDDFSYVAYGLQPAGAITVVVNYALIPEVDMDELVRQCRAALAWVYRHAESFGGDRARIYISGHSAGGHLTAMLMATEWSMFELGLPADLVKGGCGISGLYDLEPIRLCYLNDDLELTPEAAERNSPVRLARHAKGPLLLPVGGLEGPEYLRQSETLAEHWRDQGAAPEVMVMAGQDHFSIAAQLETTDSELSRAIQRQMGL